MLYNTCRMPSSAASRSSSTARVCGSVPAARTRRPFSSPRWLTCGTFPSPLDALWRLCTSTCAKKFGVSKRKRSGESSFVMRQHSRAHGAFRKDRGVLVVAHRLGELIGVDEGVDACLAGAHRLGEDL